MNQFVVQCKDPLGRYRFDLYEWGNEITLDYLIKENPMYNIFKLE